MRLLVDTHVWIWWILEHEQLEPTAAAALADPHTDVLVSAASIWEASIKIGIGKLELPADSLTDLEGVGMEPLPISAGHAALAGSLPLHHRDPFDRMLVAQTLLEDLTLVSRDTGLAAYDIPMLRA